MMNINKSHINLSETDLYFWVSAACVYEDYLWFVYGKYPLLCRYDFNCDRTEILVELPSEGKEKTDLYYKIVPLKGKLYIIPFWGKGIIVYDINNNETVKIDIDYNAEGAFQNAFVENNTILCLPSSYPFVYGLSEDEKGCVQLDIREYMKKNGIVYFNDSVQIARGKYAMVSPQSDVITVYDSNENSLYAITTKRRNRRFLNIQYLEGMIWANSNETCEIVIYDYQEKREVTTIWPQSRESIALRKGNKTILLDDLNSGWFGVCDSSFSIIAEHNLDLLQNRSSYSAYYTAKNINGDDSVCFCNSNASFVWTKETGEIEKMMKLHIDDKNLEIIKDYCYRLSYSESIQEDQFINIQYYLNRLTCEKPD